jgi:RNA polymerase sigma factor (sigma-70 family)
VSLSQRTAAQRDETLPEHHLSENEIRQLYDRHGPALMLYARSLVTDGGAAEDVVHGVFLKLLRHTRIVLEAPAAYLYRAVRNAALNAKRDRSRETPLQEQVGWLNHRDCEPEAALALQQGLQALTEEQREAVIMRIWSGMTLEEVAAATEVSINTVASRYRYALAKLRERLKPYEK